jgi:hypothetical protein
LNTQLNCGSIAPMLKSKAITLLGGTTTLAAEALGVSYQAVDKWPDDLPPRIADRVVAAIARRHLPPELIGAEGAPERPDAPPPPDAHPAPGAPNDRRHNDRRANARAAAQPISTEALAAAITANAPALANALAPAISGTPAPAIVADAPAPAAAPKPDPAAKKSEG